MRERVPAEGAGKRGNLRRRILGGHERLAHPPNVKMSPAVRCYTILFPLCATRMPLLYISISSGNTGTISQCDRGDIKDV